MLQLLSGLVKYKLPSIIRQSAKQEVLDSPSIILQEYSFLLLGGQASQPVQSIFDVFFYQKPKIVLMEVPCN
jgi:hypothetical protein